MKFFVTGATGFLGGHLVRTLVNHGHEVRALVRPSSNLSLLQELPLTKILGDLSKTSSLEEGMCGVDGVFHLAANYSFFDRPKGTIWSVNADGTKAVLQAARKLRVPRVVVTSTHGTICATEDPEKTADESAVFNMDLRGDPYISSKVEAERLVFDAVKQGQDIVIVNPTAIFGSGDHKPTPTGRLIIEFLNGKLIGYLAGGFNAVNVEDVAHGHLLAFDRGRCGERYILGGENVTMESLLTRLAVITRLPPPKYRIPPALAFGLAVLEEAKAACFRTPPLLTRAYVRSAGKYMFFDLTKARTELGYTPGAIDIGLATAAEWFFGNGYVRRQTRAQVNGPTWT